MRVAKNIAPKGNASASPQSHLSNDLVSYNEANVTYNDIRYSYGGYYGFTDITRPTISLASIIQPLLAGTETLAHLLNQAITYNEVNVSYNDLRYSYGGVYGFTDVVPIIARVYNPKPRITHFADIYNAGSVTPPSSNSGMLIGMLGMTYP
jgi:hypothetical protein